MNLHKADIVLYLAGHDANMSVKLLGLIHWSLTRFIAATKYSTASCEELWRVTARQRVITKEVNVTWQRMTSSNSRASW